jgi:glycosyltransferase involved in cell wall biosynthesis
VAIVHDYLNQPGGAERVVAELAHIWPDAPIYTTIHRPGSTHPELAGLDVRTSFLDHLPINGHFRMLGPLYPAAFRSLGVLDQDLVISSSSGWAHAMRTTPESLHVCYCYAPARWLHGWAEAGSRPVLSPMARCVLPALRRWDRNVARRPDHYISISRNVQGRLRSVHGVESEVVYPPVHADRFTARPRGERLLVVSRLLPYKRVELAVGAATKAGLPLDVVGAGPSLAALRELAGPTVEFHGRLGDDAVRELFESCRAVCVCGAEDFGLVPLESNAAGKPCVALAAGGALETLEDGVNAALFCEPTVDAVLDAIRRADAISTPPEEIRANALRFSPEGFRSDLLAAIERIRSGGRRVTEKAAAIVGE